ncbi:hypothetical protein LS2_11 [Escherichia virus LS2]|uniref:Uncharacterized protein n=1 Tax=Escherichia virus LS2 TaxID=2743776 RepID=A0ACD4QL57_9CAUD
MSTYVRTYVRTYVACMHALNYHYRIRLKVMTQSRGLHD